MRPNGPEQAVGGIRHVAVVTEGPGGIGPMVGMFGQTFLVLTVAGETSLISVQSLLELLVRIAFVHGMASHTGQFALLIASALDQSVKLAARHPDHAIGPKEVV